MLRNIFALAPSLALALVACGKGGGTHDGDRTAETPPSGGVANAPTAPRPAPAAAEQAPTPPAAAGSDTVWAGTWIRTKPVPGNGTMELTIPASGPGSIRATGSACYPADAPTPASTTIDGGKVEIAADGNGVQASYRGTVSGDEMSGTMTVSCAAGTGTGTWKLSKR